MFSAAAQPKPSDSTPRPPRLASSRVVEPACMSGTEREALIDELYAVYCEIFAGVSREAFVAYVIESHARYTWIQLHRDEGGRLVGYFAVHLYEHDLDGEPVAILRAELGMLRAYRGQRASGRLLVEKGIRYVMRHPLRRIYFMAAPIHPASYAMILKHYGDVWPRPARETPRDVLNLMCRVAQDFHLDPVDGQSPYVRKVGWQTRQTETDRIWWQRRQDEGVQFFLSKNPSYGEGNGLLTLVPGNVLRGLASVVSLFWARCRRRLLAR